MDVKERQDSHRRNLKQSISFGVWPLVRYFSTAFQNWWLQKGLSCMPSFQRNLFWNKITPHALARLDFLLSPLLSCQACAGGPKCETQPGIDLCEELPANGTAAQPAWPSANSSGRIWDGHLCLDSPGNSRKQWTKSTLVTKVVRKDGEFYSIAVTWEIRALGGGTRKKWSVSPQRKLCLRQGRFP